MIQSQWQVIEQLLGEMNDAEKRELLARVANSLSTQASDSELATQSKALEELRTQTVSLPLANPNDGLCGSDHDRILYGRPA